MKKSDDRVVVQEYQKLQYLNLRLRDRSESVAEGEREAMKAERDEKKGASKQAAARALGGSRARFFQGSDARAQLGNASNSGQTSQHRRNNNALRCAAQTVLFFFDIPSFKRWSPPFQHRLLPSAYKRWASRSFNEP